MMEVIKRRLFCLKHIKVSVDSSLYFYSIETSYKTAPRLEKVPFSQGLNIPFIS
jgi:hypothetical protein